MHSNHSVSIAGVPTSATTDQQRQVRGHGRGRRCQQGRGKVSGRGEMPPISNTNAIHVVSDSEETHAAKPSPELNELDDPVFSQESDGGLSSVTDGIDADHLDTEVEDVGNQDDDDMDLDLDVPMPMSSSDVAPPVAHAQREEAGEANVRSRNRPRAGIPRISRGFAPSSRWNQSTVWISNISIVQRFDTKAN